MSIEQAVEEVRKNFLSKKNVNGIGVGEKWVGGTNTHEPALLVFVTAKEHPSALSSFDVVPSSVNGIKTDVVGRSGIFRSHSNTARVRPVQPGYSCGNIAVTAGTIGGFFTDQNGDVVGLSNNHVLANSNRAAVGSQIVQPGVYDAANWSGNVIGTLKHYRDLVGHGQGSFNAADWTPITGYNLEDSAIFKVTNGLPLITAIPGVGELNGFNDTVTIGQTLTKVGRTTGLTTGIVVSTGTTVTVSYDAGITYEFHDQIVTSGMSQGGDSGSLLLDSSRNVVGLLFAGSDTMTIHNRIRYPRASWGLNIYHSAPLVETLTYTVTVDGTTRVNSYGENDFASALSDARAIARAGHNVTVSVSFTTHP